MAEKKDQDQKTEKPTDKRLHEAHDRGQFARSADFNVLFILAAVLGVLGFTTRTASQEVGEYAVGMFSHFASISVERDTITKQLAEAVVVVVKALTPLLVAVVAAALLAGGIQSGFRLTPKAAAFKFDNLDVVAGFQRLFNKEVFVKTGIDVLKLAAIGSVLWIGARSLLADPLFTSPVDAAYLARFLSSATLEFLGRMLVGLGVVVAVSYSWEKFKTGRELMMTREEVKEERRQAEGDMHSKAAMRRMARRLMQRQMLSAVPTADVVVTNPTHFAVALKYERGRDQAPVVLAKGENRFAQRLKALAAEHGVPMVENKPVARLLFAVGKVGETIPPELYQAVAEILAVVYRTHRYYFHCLKARRLGGAVA
jgi:flagellar biosynthetic protein FlhB